MLQECGLDYKKQDCVMCNLNSRMWTTLITYNPIVQVLKKMISWYIQTGKFNRMGLQNLYRIQDKVKMIKRIQWCIIFKETKDTQEAHVRMSYGSDSQAVTKLQYNTEIV